MPEVLRKAMTCSGKEKMMCNEPTATASPPPKPVLKLSTEFWRGGRKGRRQWSPCGWALHMKLHSGEPLTELCPFRS